jgi:hypothetical protein
MKDRLNQEVIVGDYVCTITKGYRDLVFCKVIALTPKKIKVEYNHPNIKNHMIETTVFPEQAVKIDEELAMAYLLGAGAE